MNARIARLRSALTRAAAALLAVALLSGCAARAARDPGTLVALELGDAGSINPLLTNQYYAFLYQWLVFEPLVNTGANYKPIPSLATAWSHTSDGLHWTVHLRRGVRWSDGAPFTAEDVVFTWDAILDPKTGDPYTGQYAYIKRCVALDPSTVRFDLSSKNATFETVALNMWIVPEHILGKVAHAQIRTTNFGEHPIGTGPYVLSSWRHDEEAQFAANPLWWGGPQSVKRIDIRVVLDDQAREEAMRDGNADFDDGVGIGSSQRLAKVPNVRMLRLPDLYTRFMQLNLHTKGLDDLAVRQAMLYAWDRFHYASGLFRGDNTVSSSVEPEAIPFWHDASVKPYPYDIAKANALLDAAGWKRGPDGIRSKNGVRLAFTLVLPNGASSSDIAADFQADERDAGIAIDVRQLDYATFIDETNNSKFDLAFTGWGGSPDPDQFTLLDSSQAPPTGNNYGFYKNAAVDHDLRAGLVELDDRKRQALYNDFQRRTAHDVPVLFGTNEVYHAAFNKRVTIEGPILPGLYLWLNVARWKLAPIGAGATGT